MLITADLGDGGTTSDATGPSTVVLEVDPDRLHATAASIEEVAHSLQHWMTNNRDSFNVESAGSDSVSQGISDFFNDTAENGAFVQVQKAVANLLSFAGKLRESAKQYGLVDDTSAANLTSSANPA